MYIALLGKMKFKNMQILGELTTKRSTPYLTEAKNELKTPNRKK